MFRLRDLESSKPNLQPDGHLRSVYVVAVAQDGLTFARCEPTVHRWRFTDSTSLGFLHGEPTAHRCHHCRPSRPDWLLQLARSCQ